MNKDIAIIIPCFNSKKTIFYTLSSISIQKDINCFKVYLINDKSDYNYKEEVKFFSNFYDIEEIILKKNLGPGGTRREGILRTKEKYIMFIDSDDILYDCYSLRNLYIACQNYDICISNFILERDGVRVIKSKNYIWLHGKMYNREFLNKYNINFNDTRANEDNGFNRLILLLKPNIKYLNQITYVYKENNNSITRKNNRSYKIFGLEGFIDNMIWAIEEALKRKVDPAFVPVLSTNILVAMYYYYLSNIDKKEVYNILIYSKKILPYYLNYKKISNELLNNYFIEHEKILTEENNKFEKVISFNDFIRKVEEYD